MSYPVISVALATYNGARYVEEQLASILAQTRSVDEIVVSDDGSSDGTQQIVTEYARRSGLPIAMIGGDEHLGVVANFERALKSCRGEIVFLCDQDDIWAPEKVERLVAALEARVMLAAVFTDAEVVDESRRRQHRSLLELARLTAGERRLIEQGDAFEVLLTRNVALGATIALRKSALETLVPIPEGYVHDEWIALQSASRNAIGFVAEPLIQYRQHSQNAIGAPKPTTLREKLASLHKPARRERRAAADKARRLVERLSLDSGTSARRVDQARKLLRHLLLRADLPNSRLLRIVPICRELLNAGYFRYSMGMKAALRDLLQRLE